MHKLNVNLRHMHNVLLALKQLCVSIRNLLLQRDYIKSVHSSKRMVNVVTDYPFVGNASFQSKVLKQFCHKICGTRKTGYYTVTLHKIDHVRRKFVSSVVFPLLIQEQIC